MAELDKAIGLDTTRSEYYLQRGELKIQMGEKENGCSDFKKYKELGGSISIKNSCN